MNSFHMRTKHGHHHFQILGKLRLGTKSDIVSCLEKLVPSSDLSANVADMLTVKAIILDGAAIVNMLKPGASLTFVDYVAEVLLPYNSKQLQSVKRLDFVRENYVQGSLKAYTRLTKGKGTRRHVEPSNAVPINYTMEFLINDENKNCFSFLSLETSKLHTESQVIITHHQDVLCIHQRNTTCLATCTQEEADTTIFLHVADTVTHGNEKVMIQTVDTDVLVMAVAAVQQFPIEELWLAFASSTTFIYIPAHEIAHGLGHEKCIALPFLRVFSGCDTVMSVMLCWPWKEVCLGNMEHV